MSPVALVSGACDRLSGRCVALKDDLDDLVNRIGGDARVLRMQPPSG
ncbi:hypothetical protein [Lentzea fradiae]|nr:hypothetical protein [Lentzea fradiae]